MTVEDFGGGQPLPSILGRATANDGWAQASDGNWCWGQDVSSAVRGLWEFQIQATNSVGVTKTWKQLVGWMRPTTPVLHEIAATDPTGDALLGDPLGDGMFTAGSLPGRIQVKIKGTMPTQIGSSGSTIPINTVLTLPDDWRRMADAYAQDNGSPITGSQSPKAVAGWDIHDDDVIRPDLREGGVLPRRHSARPSTRSRFRRMASRTAIPSTTSATATPSSTGSIRLHRPTTRSR